MESGQCTPYRGESRRALRVKIARIPPDYPHTILIIVLVYAALSSVVRPDTRSSHWQFIP